jgi:hypothetical protein
MTDEYIYTMRINKIEKKWGRRIKANRYDQNLSFVDKECFCMDCFGIKVESKERKIWSVFPYE